MIGAFIGDTIGSRFERNNVKSKEFELFTEDSIYTDDTILTIAIAYALLNNESFMENLKFFGNKYPRDEYGDMFKQWLSSETSECYNSFGNGSAMRVSPVGYISDEIDVVLECAKQSAEVTHNHPEGIKGAQAVALAILLARTGSTKEQIKQEIETRFNYNLSRTIDEIRPLYNLGKFDATCQGSVPEAIIAFLDSTDFEDSIRNAVSIGGDSDTIACITGSISEAYYQEIPQFMIDETIKRLPKGFIRILDMFNDKFNVKVYK